MRPRTLTEAQRVIDNAAEAFDQAKAQQRPQAELEALAEVLSRALEAKRNLRTVIDNRNRARRERDECFKDIGLRRGKDSLGRVIWE